WTITGWKTSSRTPPCARASRSPATRNEGDLTPAGRGGGLVHQEPVRGGQGPVRAAGAPGPGRARGRERPPGAGGGAPPDRRPPGRRAGAAPAPDITRSVLPGGAAPSAFPRRA